ncbi:hypothetical protein [Devosia sp. LjRoot3]|uniref:hypothetical protein n=1 Tax=Devosia sp. LjRoot3 TaxID=3342319 RepID=UPI003ED05BE3
MLEGNAASEAKRVLSVGITSTDRTRAIIDGRVTIPGIDMKLTIDEPQALFRSGQVGHQLDVAEMSLGTHLLQTDMGTAAYWAIPIYLSRAFRHGSIFVRSDRSILAPANLNGRRIGIAGFQQTATIWARGILAEHYGLDLASVSWIVGGVDAPGNLERTTLPAGVPRHLEPAGDDKTLNAMLLAGEIDAIISPAPPVGARGADAPIKSLFGNCAEEERQYFAKTGIFPVMHVLGIKKAQADDDIVAGLFDAFTAAKNLAQSELLKGNYLRVSLPWVADEARRTIEVMGENPWSYGLAQNRAGLEAMLRYACADGLIGADRTVESLFYPASLTMAERSNG